MFNVNNNLFWQVKEPHAIFDETGLGTETLLLSLDRKLQEISGKRNALKEGRRFRSWLRKVQSAIHALVFHAGEIVFDKTERISMHILCDEQLLDQVSQSIINAQLDTFRCSISDYMGLADACTVNEGSQLRAFFSSELLIAAKSHQEMKMLDMHTLSIKDIFEDGNVLPDVGMMVAYEISEIAHMNKDGNGKTIEIDEKEFHSMAKNALKMRRVNPHMHQKVIPFVKKAIGIRG